jgi:hypothetical protein
MASAGATNQRARGRRHEARPFDFGGGAPGTAGRPLNATSSLRSVVAGHQAPGLPQEPWDRMNVRIAFDLRGSFWRDGCKCLKLRIGLTLGADDL